MDRIFSLPIFAHFEETRYLFGALYRMVHTRFPPDAHVGHVDLTDNPLDFRLQGDPQASPMHHPCDQASSLTHLALG